MVKYLNHDFIKIFRIAKIFIHLAYLVNLNKIKVQDKMKELLTFNIKKMAKQVCENCSAEVGFFQQVKMKDGNFVCRKCAGKTHPLFEPVNQRTLSVFNEHRKQLEEGKLLYEKLFVPRKKPVDKSQKLKKFSGGIEAAKDIGLVAFVGKRGGFMFWGGTYYYMVFRMADLYKYDYSFETKTGSDGKSKVDHFMNFAFWEASGLNQFRVNVFSDVGFISAAGFFDECFGLKRDLKSMTSQWKGHLANVKGAVKGLKNMLSGDGNKEEGVEQLSRAAFNELYGDRTEWIAKADAAIKSVMN